MRKYLEIMENSKYRINLSKIVEKSRKDEK